MINKPKILVAISYFHKKARYHSFSMSTLGMQIKAKGKDNIK